MSTSHFSPNAEVPSHTACAHCRSQKVRCIRHESNPDVCERCARSGRSCVFTPLQKRKQRKRTDTRVAELEREMRAMQSMLQHKNKKQYAGSDSTKEGGALGRPANLHDADNAPNRTNNDGVTMLLRPNNGLAQQRPILDSQPQNVIFNSRPTRVADRPLVENNTTRDVIDRDIISMATARQLFETYRKQLFPHYPMVPISNSISAEEMRKSKPVLFLAVIAAAAGKDHPDISAALDQEVLHTYATKSLLHSQKSLEIVQALLISAVWYYPPNRFVHLKYYEYIHMAATIAMDIGIGTRSVPHRSRFGTTAVIKECQAPAVHPLEDTTNPDLSMAPRSRNASPEASSIESRRTFVSCYSICAQVSISLRRPNMLRMSSYVRECVDYLERSADALASDRMLVAWIRLVIISEEISTAFSYDDPGGIASITELRTQLMLKDFARRLELWYASVSEANRNSTMTIIYWTTHLYLHEIALHVDHSPDDFKAPYQMGTIHPWDGEEVPSQVLAESVAACIRCSHNLINIFLAIEVEALRTLPVLAYVRVSYAAFVLAKLCFSATHPSSHIGRVLDRNSVKAEAILDRAILHVQTVLNSGRCRVPAIFLALLFKLRQWCMHPELIEPPQGNFLDVGMQNPADEPSKKDHVRSMTSSENSRVTDAESPDDNSPHISSNSDASTYENVDGVGVQESKEAGSVPPSGRSQELPNIDLHSVLDTSNAEPPVFLADDAASQVTGFLNPNDQMELDQSFLQFFGAINGPDEPDLTFLDEWSSLPTDMLGL